MASAESMGMLKSHAQNRILEGCFSLIIDSSLTFLISQASLLPVGGSWHSTKIVMLYIIASYSPLLNYLAQVSCWSQLRCECLLCIEDDTVNLLYGTVAYETRGRNQGPSGQPSRWIPILTFTSEPRQQYKDNIHSHCCEWSKTIYYVTYNICEIYFLHFPHTNTNL